MKVLFDLPVILFFLAYTGAKRAPGDRGIRGLEPPRRGGAAGAVSVDQAPILLAPLAILATFGQVGWVLARGRKVDSMLGSASPSS
jgi:intracellular septation protein